VIKKIASFRELPYNIYTGYLLKSEEDANKYDEGYLIITKSPKMVILFVDFIEEINNKP
jgi:hypothetical protein